MMGKYKMFISHSSKDSNAVNAFIGFLLKIGMSEKNIVCTSVAGTHYNGSVVKTKI